MIQENNATEMADEYLSFVEVPAWVDLIDRQALVPVTPAEGVVFLLSDVQINATQQAHERFYRVVKVADSSAGLAAVAEFNINFDPSWARVGFHYLRVLRDGNVVWEASRADFQILQRERGLERRLYDGTLTADILISDVRVGDVVDWAYSIVGEDPVIEGRIAMNWALSWSVPVAMTHGRLVVNQGHDIKIRLANDAPQPEIIHQNGQTHYVWKVRNEVGVALESYTPPGYRAEKFVELSDAKSWEEISDLYRTQYQYEADLPETLKPSVDEIRDTYQGDIGRQTLGALRLVQGEVRYLALSMGTGGLAPRASEVIWASRFGDCKDKSRLLVAILKYLGIDACPALVNSYLGESVGSSLPNAYAFNHCIVRVEIEGQTYYFDPALLPQAGTLETITKLDYGYALPLRPHSDLEKMPDTNIPHVVDFQEEWRIHDDPDKPATVKLIATFKSWYADRTRNQLLQDGAARVSKDYATFYDQRYRGMTPTQETVFHDDFDANTITITEHYQLTKPYQSVGDKPGSLRFEWFPEEIFPDLGISGISERRAPYDLGVTRKKTRRAVFQFDRGSSIGLARRDDKIVSKGWSLENVWTIPTQDQLCITDLYEVERGSIEPKDMPAFVADIQRAQALAGLNYTPVTTATMPKSTKQNALDGLWIALTFLAIIVIVALNR